MSCSKEITKESLSPYTVWKTAYEFLTHNIKEWAIKIFSELVDPSTITSFIYEFVVLVVNLITSGVTVFSVNSKILMSLAGASFFVNFNLAFQKIASLFPNFHPVEAMKNFFGFVTDYTKDREEQIFPNAEDAESSWIQHMKSILTAFFSAIVGGLGYLSDGTKGIANAFRLVTFSKAGIENVQAIVEKTMDKIALDKTDPLEPEREAVLEMVTRGQAILKMTLGEIASKNENKNKVKNFIQESTHSLTLYKSPDTNSLRLMLVGIIRDVNKKLEEIEQIIRVRQVTTGIMLLGDKGVGKSSLVTHLTKMLAKEFMLQDRLYTVSSGVRFYEPYLNEDFGVVNEFGSTTKEETFVHDANRICSSDPFNFESASLAGKIGSCQLKGLFVTSNVKTPIVPELRTSSVSAFWDRFIIVKVEDPLVKNRRTVYSHRKPDFSHLTFHVMVVSDEENQELEFQVKLKDISINSLFQILAYKMATETEKFYHAIDVRPEPELQSVLDKWLRSSYVSLAPFYFEKQGAENIVPNSAGRNFCMMRIQGIEGTGKTTVAESLSEKWIKLTTSPDNKPRFKQQLSNSLRSFQPIEEPCVYIFDDWLRSTMSDIDIQLYLEKINLTNSESIFIITTNEVIRRVRIIDDFWSSIYTAACGMDRRSPYDLKNFQTTYSGFLRRIGLDDHYMVGKTVHKVNSTAYCSVINVDLKGCYKHDNLNISQQSMLELIKEKFIAMQKDKFSLTILREKPEEEDMEVDMELICDNADILFNKLKTTVGTASLYLNPTSQASLTVSDRIKTGATNLGRAVKPADFICDEIFSKEIPHEERYITIVERMVRVLLQYYETPTFRIIIKDTSEVIYSKDSIVYYYNEKNNIYIITEDDRVQINLSKPKVINAKDFATMLCATKIEERFASGVLTMVEYTELEAYYRRQVKQGDYNNFVTEVAKHEMDILKRQKDTYQKEMAIMRNNKLLKIALCGLVGVSSLGALYGIYRFVSNNFFSTREEDLQVNSFANVGSTPPKRSESNQSKRNKIALGTELIKANSPYDKYSKSSRVLRVNDYKQDSDVEEELFVNSPYVKTKNKSSRVLQVNSNNYEDSAESDDDNEEDNDKVEYIHKRNIKHDKEPHTHVCPNCECLYSHIHAYNKNAAHIQWHNQCPNPECKSYHKSENKYSAVLIQEKFSDTFSDYGTPNAIIRTLGDACSPIHDELLRVLSSYNKTKRNVIHDKLLQMDRMNKNAIKVLRKYKEISALLDTVVVANMLTDADMIRAEETDLEILHRQLTRSYVKVSVGAQNSYGVHVGNGYYLTVSHSFDEVGQGAMLSSSGMRYNSTCIALLRNRDISVLYCKELGNLPSAKKYFVNDSEDLDRNGYFMRCGPTFEVISGALEYKAYQGQLEGRSSIGEKFSPTTEILKIRRIGLECEKVIKRGDCGFPFVCRVGSTMRVIGFHNAYKITSSFFGAFINKTLIEDLCSITIPNSTQLSTCAVVALPAIVDTELTHINMSIPLEYLNCIEQAVRPDPYFPKTTNSTSLITLGFNKVFKNYAVQKEKHITHDLDLINENLTLPAAYSMEYVEDTSELILDGQGKPHPLWTQACKYNLSYPSYDQETLEHAIELCYDYNKLTYATRPFRILTEFEAINGMRDPFLTNVDITTSAGPYARYFGKVLKKRDIFDVRFERDQPIYSFNNSKTAQDIRNHLKTQTQLLEEKFIPPCLVSQDNAKVENISRDKAKKGKVRLFNNVDPNINAILKRYFGDWFAHVMDKHQEGYYAVGQDPYITSTEIYHAFETKLGRVLNTDFKTFDKLLTPELIKAFCVIGSRLTKPKYGKSRDETYSIYCALARTLTHALHILNGSLYMVNNGNESGTFVTTLLNCVSVHIIFNYTFIKMWQRVPQYVNITPTLKDIMKRSEIRILGDDKTQKVTYDVPMEEEDLIYYAKELGMKCTSAKGDYHNEELIDFCSRVLYWSEKDQVVFPRLKKESINGLLYWFASFSVNQVRDNLMSALFEASFYEEEYYQSVLDDALVVAKAFGVDPRTIPFTNYVMARKRLVSFMMNDIECQDMSALADRETKYDSADITKLLKRHILSENKNDINRIRGDISIESLTSKEKRSQKLLAVDSLTDENNMASSDCANNPISKCLELIAKLKKPTPRESFTKSGPDHCPTYSCELHFEDRTFGGEGASKTDAKKQAYGALRHYLIDNIIPNSEDAINVREANRAIEKIAFRVTSLYIESHIKTAAENSDGKRFVKLNSKNVFKGSVENINGFHVYYRDGSRYVVSPILSEVSSAATKTCYLRYPGIRYDSITEEIVLDIHHETTTWAIRTNDHKSYSDDESLIYANSLRKITAVLENMIIPNSSEDPPKLGVMANDNPLVVPSAAILASDNEIVKPVIMNYSAPSNAWMNAGGIMHNVFDLIYNQYLWSTQFLVESTADRGKIIMQIPYTPVNNTFASSYITNALLLHGRFSGDWIVRLTCPGSASGMQGALIVSWQPKKISGTTANMEDLTKYSYFTESIASPWTQDIVMRDARQSNFYRSVPRSSGVTTSDDNQPHIVIAVESPGVSTFKDSNKVYISVASKLCSFNDQKLNPSIKPFVMADPQNSLKYDPTKGFSLNF
ncbi:MAG: RNA helicase [Hangzhou Solinvi-like virus 2]|nr:MAG: RNA helicase [Hangzhou Solinvi-like virus 2]